jgi:hypothetical protein
VEPNAGDKKADELALSDEPSAVANPARPFAEKLAVYAGRYKTDVRTVKRWAAVGRAATPADLPPLDRARELPTWWLRHMKNRVPAAMLEAAAADDVRHQAAAVPPTVTSPTATTVEDRAVFLDVGMGETVVRFRKAEREAGEAYEAAVNAKDKDGNPVEIDQGRVAMLQRRWKDLGEALRKAVKDEAEMAEQRGELLEKGAVSRLLQEIHSSIAESIRGLARRVRPKLATLPPSEQDAVWEAEVERTFSGFQDEFAA